MKQKARCPTSADILDFAITIADLFGDESVQVVITIQRSDTTILASHIPLHKTASVLRAALGIAESRFMAAHETLQ